MLDGLCEAVDYDLIIPIYASAMRSLRTRIVNLETENAILDDSNVNLTQRVTQLETIVQSLDARLTALEARVL